MIRRGNQLLALLLLSACASSPPVIAPSVSSAAQGPFLSLGSNSADGLPLPAGWWRLYNDPVLDQLVAQALSQNLSLKVAVANLAEAEGFLSEARAGRFPTSQLTGGPNFGRGQGKAGLGAPGALTYAAGFMAAYQVDLFGRVGRAIAAAKADRESLEATSDAVRVTVAAQTAAAYAAACGYGRQVGVAQASLRLVQQTYDIAQRQSKAGALSDFDLARQGALLGQAKAAVAPLEGARRASLFALATLTGRPPGQIPPAAATCDTPPRLSRLLPVGDGAALLKRRPDLRAAERALAAADARIGVARADLYPTITLGGGVGQDTALNGGVSSASALAYSLGPLVTWSFPNIVVARAHIRQATARSRAAQARFDGAVLQALQETETALSNYASELDRHAALDDARLNADRAARLAKVQADVGATSFLDLLQAQQTALIADQALAASDQAVSADQITVFQALGGGWEIGR